MPINPEEIGKVVEGVEKAATAVEKSGGVAKAAESIAAKGEKTAKTFVRDAKGRFASATKGAAKTTAASAAGAAVEDAMSSKGSTGNTDQGATDQAGASRTRTVPNPGSNSPAGRVDLPHVDSAEDLANNVDESAFTDTRGMKGPSGNSEDTSNRKLNKIINLLQSILSVEKRNTVIMGTGFRNLENTIDTVFMTQTNREQVKDMESASQGGGFLGLGSNMSDPIKMTKMSLKGLGLAVLGAFATGATVETAKRYGDKNGKTGNAHQVVAKTQDSIISKYKEEYGKHWAQKLIADDFSQHQNNKGFLEELADKQGPAALYLPIKQAYDKASDKDKKEIVDAIAALLKVSPDTVEKQIARENVRAVQVAKAAETGVMNAAIHAASSTIGGGIKYGGKAVGALSSAAGSALDFFGQYNAGAFFKKEGSTISKNATEKGDALSSSINKGTEYIPSTGKMEAFYNPNSYKAGEIGFDVGTAAFVPGGKAKMISMGLAGGLDLLGNDSSYFGKDTFQLDKDEHGVSKGKKLSPEARTRAKKAIAFFQGKGWSKEQAEGIVANLLVESNYTLDPHQGQIGGGGGYGIAQWTSKDRKNEFKNQEKVPLEQSTFEQQLDFVNWELNNTEGKAGKELKGAKTVSDASKIVTHDYERPRDLDQQTEFRSLYAQAISKQFDENSIRPQTQVASTAEPSPSINFNQGGTNISRNTTIQSASATAPGYLLNNVTSTI